MANSPHLFEDLCLINKGKQVDGIGAGLEIEGTGTFFMRISDNDGKTHKIKIPNSLYLPKLRQCLLLPQHWAQEAKAKRGNKGKTWMENYWDTCILIWERGKFKRSIQHDPSMNTLSFYSAPASKTYCSFATTFEACKAAFYRREHILQVPGLRERAPEEFVANKNIHLCDALVADADKVREDDNTVKTANRSEDLPPSYTPSEQAERQGLLTFDLLPPAAEDDSPTLAAADNQAELMQWHYRLGHASFKARKQMAKNGEISKQLAKVPLPRCAGCLFGAMTKIPWRGKESKASHEVFVTTKPGECILVNQMVSTQVGFYAQLKSKLTNRCYRGATIFIDHFSRL